MWFSGWITPSSNPAMVMMILKVEPGGYWPWVARLFSGRN